MVQTITSAPFCGFAIAQHSGGEPMTTRLARFVPERGASFRSEAAIARTPPASATPVRLGDLLPGALARYGIGSEAERSCG